MARTVKTEEDVAKLLGAKVAHTPEPEKVVETPVTAKDFNVPSGYKLVPENYEVVPPGFIVLPEKVYQDLMSRPQSSAGTSSVEDTSDKKILRVLHSFYLGDVRENVSEGDLIEYYPRRKFILRGKPYEKLSSLSLMLKKKREYFEVLDNVDDLEKDSLGDYVTSGESNEEYKQRVAAEERIEPKSQTLSRKEMIAQMGKTTTKVLTEAAPQKDSLPPKGSPERKALIVARGNRTHLGSEPVEKLSDFKVTNTSQDTREVGRIGGPSATERKVNTNPIVS